MSDTVNFEQYEKLRYKQQFDDIVDQFDTIVKWVQKDFQDIDFSVEFNDDTSNPNLPAFKIKCRIFTKKYMDPLYEDQLLKKHDFRIPAVVWNDPMLMQKWIANLVPMFKRTISEEVNNWYQTRKLKATH